MKFAPKPTGGWTDEERALLHERNKRMWEQRMNGQTYRSIADSHGLKTAERVRQIILKFERTIAYHTRMGGYYWGA